MKKYTNIITSKSGDALAGITVKVMNQDGTTATIYSGNGTTQIPGGVVTTDGGGIFSFYATNGRYNLQISGQGINTYTLQDELLYDPHDDESSLAGKVNAVDLASTAIGKGMDLIGDSIRASSLANTANGSGADLIANVAKKVASIAALRALRVPQGSDAQTAIVDGYTAANDGGQGVAIWNATDSRADDNGVIIKPAEITGAGRWNRQLNGFVTPEMYGAKADGTTDDTTAVNAALTYADATNLQVIFAPGKTYLIGPVIISQNTIVPVSVKGYRTILKAKPGSTGPLVTIENPHGKHPFFEFSGFTLDANGACSNGLYVHGSQVCYYKGIKAINATGVGVRVYGEAGYGIYYNKFERIQSGDYGLSNAKGFEIKSAAGTYSNANNTFDTCQAQFNKGLGWDIDWANNTYINPDAESNDNIGFAFDNTTATSIDAGYSEYNNQNRATGPQNANADTSFSFTTNSFVTTTQGRHIGTYTGSIAHCSLNHTGNMQLHPAGGVAYGGATPQQGTTAFPGGSDWFFTLGGANYMQLMASGGFNFFKPVYVQNSNAAIYAGSGNPNGVVTAQPGSIYLNQSGGAGATFWVKESTGGNTGWVAK